MIDATEGVLWRRIAGPLFLLRAAGQGLEFLGWVVLARRLGASDFGMLSIAFLIARYAGLLADWGASIGGPRDVVRDDEDRTMTRALIAHRRNMTILLGAMFGIGCAVTGNADMALVVSVIAMLGLSRDWIAIGEHKGARAAVPLLVQGSVLLGTAVLLTSAQVPAVAVCCGYGASAITSIWLNRLPPRSARASTSHRPTPALQPWMLGAVMTNQVLSSSDVLLLGLLGTTAATGIYSAVYRIPNGWLAGVSILAGALLPVATRAAPHPGRLQQLRRRSFMVSIGAALLLLAITPLVFILIPLIFGPEYESGRWPAVVLLVATAVATAAAPLHQFYLTRGNDRRYAGFLAVSAVVIVIGGIVLIPRYSMIGAALSTLIAHIVLASTLTVAVVGTADSERDPGGESHAL